MKNKVLRLAIVAVLVVAMVLSMAACEKKPVDPSPVVTPTPSKTPDVTVAPSTPTPSKTPEVSTDEAKLESEYGITFPVAEGMKIDFVKDAATLKVIDADKDTVTFGAKAPTYNDAFNAYKDAITVTAKVNGLTAEGDKIDLGNNLENNDGAKNLWVKFTPKAAGTYTVVYTVKVAYASPETGYGLYIPAKRSETYTVTKTYEVAKKAITIESVSDAHGIKTGLSYPPATLKIGDLIDSQQGVVKNELKLAGENRKFDLSIDFVSADLTAYGTYPLKLVCLDTKGQKVDVATLVAPDFDVTFKEGNRYVLTDAELAAAVAARDAVKAAQLANANKEDIELGVATYAALSEASKTWFNQDFADPTSVPAHTNADYVTAMNAKQANLSKLGLVAEAKALAKTWNDKLQNAEDATKFVTYMLSLGTDYEFVKTALTPSVPTTSYLDEALALIESYKARVLNNFTTQFVNGFMPKLQAIMGKELTGGAFDKAAIENLANAVAKLQAAYDALVTGQSALTITEANAIADVLDITPKTPLFVATDTMANLMTRTSKASEELTARYAAYATLVDGLDAYTGDKVTKTNVTKMLGYDFKLKVVDFAKAKPEAAAKVIFATEAALSNGYVVFTTPMFFVNNATKSFKTIVDAYVALDAAIVSAQKDVITNLGSKIKFAVDDKIWVKTFDAATSKFVNSDTPVVVKDSKSRLKALQDYIADTAITAVQGSSNEAPFAALAKKELSVVIAAALKDPVAAVNAYIKDETAFMFTITDKTLGTTPVITLTDFFALTGDLTAYGKVLTINLYKAGKGDAIPATVASIEVNKISGLTFGTAAVANGDTIEVIYNGVAYAPITVTVS